MKNRVHPPHLDVQILVETSGIAMAFDWFWMHPSSATKTTCTEKLGPPGLSPHTAGGDPNKWGGALCGSCPLFGVCFRETKRRTWKATFFGGPLKHDTPKRIAR